MTDFFVQSILIIGLVTFATKLPKYLEDATGIKSGNMKLGIKDKLADGGLFAAGSFIDAHARKAFNDGSESLLEKQKGNKWKNKSKLGRFISGAGSFLGAGLNPLNMTAGANALISGGYKARSIEEAKKFGNQGYENIQERKKNKAERKRRHEKDGTNNVTDAIEGFMEYAGLAPSVELIDRKIEIAKQSVESLKKVKDGGKTLLEHGRVGSSKGLRDQYNEDTNYKLDYKSSFVYSNLKNHVDNFKNQEYSGGSGEFLMPDMFSDPNIDPSDPRSKVALKDATRLGKDIKLGSDAVLKTDFTFKSDKLIKPAKVLDSDMVVREDMILQDDMIIDGKLKKAGEIIYKGRVLKKGTVVEKEEVIKAGTVMKAGTVIKAGEELSNGMIIEAGATKEDGTILDAGTLRGFKSENERAEIITDADRLTGDVKRNNAKFITEMALQEDGVERITQMDAGITKIDDLKTEILNIRRNGQNAHRITSENYDVVLEQRKEYGNQHSEDHIIIENVEDYNKLLDGVTIYDQLNENKIAGDNAIADLELKKNEIIAAKQQKKAEKSKKD